MGQHAILAPSSAGRWVPCPGSVQFEAMYPEDETVHPMTMEGDAIHEVASKMLVEFVEGARADYAIDRAKFLNTTTSNGTVVTNDMLDVAQMYVEDVIRVSKRFNGLAKVFIEHRVYMPNIHPENWGTLDACIVFFDPESDELVIEDLKAGWGTVEVWDNWQLLNYVVGLLNEMIQRGWALPKVVELRLCQPRPRHPDGRIRVQRITMAELEPYVLKMRESAINAFTATPTLNTGRQCDHCRARHECPALRNTGYRVFEVLQGIEARRLKGAELGAHLDMLDEAKALVKALQSALEDQALIDIQRGEAVPGWEWKQKETRVNWTVPIEEVHVLGDLYGVELREVSAPTPRQAVTKGMPEEVVNGISASRTAGFELTRANLKLAAKIFKQPNE